MTANSDCENPYGNTFFYRSYLSSGQVDEVVDVFEHGPHSHDEEQELFCLVVDFFAFVFGSCKNENYKNLS